MIGVDTNVLVRVLVGDAPEQSRQALAFLSARSTDDPAYVSPVVMVELVWVLQRTYGYSRERVGTAINTLFQSANIFVERHDLMQSAIAAAERKRADFADCIIAALASDAGASRTVTFDRDAAKHVPGMDLLK